MTPLQTIQTKSQVIIERAEGFLNSREGKWLIWGVAIAGVLLRLLNLTAKPFWFDEAYVYWVSIGDWSDLVYRHRTYHIDPPFVGIFINVFDRLGMPPEAMRILPFSFGSGAVLLFAYYALQNLSRFAALVSVVIVSFSYGGIAYSQEVTEYPIGMFLTVALLVSTPWPGEEMRIWNWKWVVTAVLWILSPWIFYGMAIVLAAFSVVWAMQWYFCTERRWRELAYFGALNLLTALSAVIVYAFFAKYQLHKAEMPYLEPYYAHFHSLPGLLAHIFRGLRSMTEFAFGGKWVLTLLMIAGIGLMLPQKRRAEWLWVFLAMLAFLYLASAMALYPFYGGRQTMFLIPFVALAIASFLERLASAKSFYLKLGGLGLLLLLTLYGLRLSMNYHRFDGNENILPSIAHIRDNAQEGEGIYLYPTAMPAFFIHGKKLELPTYRPMENPMDVIFTREKNLKKDVQAFVARYPRTWMLFSHYGDDAVQEITAALQPDYSVERIRRDLGAELWLATRRTGTLKDND